MNKIKNWIRNKLFGCCGLFDKKTYWHPMTNYISKDYPALIGQAVKRHRLYTWWDRQKCWILPIIWGIVINIVWNIFDK